MGDRMADRRDVSDAELDVDYKRPMTRDPKDAHCFELIRSWQEECEVHSGCPRALPTRLPKRIIEIPIDPSEPSRLRVTDSCELGQYVILSHCWGSLRVLKLLDHLLPQFRNAISSELLPTSFKDAIYITRRLGFRYLWIDALCISQDNPADWNEETPKMASYYGQSTLMIAATTAEDSSKGILTDRHVPYSPAMGKEKKYCLRQRLLRWDWDIERSILASRGWAAQERMLAPRILHYTKRQTIWECAEGLKFEASGIRDDEVGSGQVSQRFNKNKLQPFFTQCLRLGSDECDKEAAISSPGPDSDLANDTIARLRTWQQCVDEYAKRNLTVPSDKFHAISGVAAIMNRDQELGHYLAGIWSKHVAAGLAWSRQWALLTSPPTYRAPSWSWASVDGVSSSLVLVSSPELLEPPDSELGKRWATTFDLELIEHNMKLQDVSQDYGSVLEGSYIIVKGSCIAREELGVLLQAVPHINTNMVIAFDKSTAADCPCCRPSGQKGRENLEDTKAHQHQKNLDDKEGIGEDLGGTSQDDGNECAKS